MASAAPEWSWYDEVDRFVVYVVRWILLLGIAAVVVRAVAVGVTDWTQLGIGPAAGIARLRLPRRPP